MGFYTKESDKDILEEIRNVIIQRPAYGYKRVTAMVNKSRSKLLLPHLNRKRIYRIMKINSLILPKNLKLRDHKATGKVMTLHSNTRWCSDCFEIRCFNGERVFVAFSLDTCDREIINYVIQQRHIQADDIKELMISSVESRFATTKTPRLVEWLSDRGSVYRAHSVNFLAQQLGLKTCFTAGYSPESNGMAEAFVGTFKRDYVYVNDCFSAKVVSKMIPEWIEDYNNNAPHSALGMKSPVEYRMSLNQ